MSFRLALAGVLFLAGSSAAEDSLPPLHETELSEFDLAALQAGEWVEHEMTGPQWPARGGKKVVRRMACVKVEGGVARVEVTWRNGAPVYDGLVLVYEADRETRKVRRAWSGKAGGVAKELKVHAGPPGGGVGAPGGAPTLTGTAKVTREKIKVGGASLDCETVELDLLLVANCCETKTKTSVAVCEKVPFRVWTQEPRAEGAKVDIQWPAKPEVRGGLVRSTLSREAAKVSVTLLKWGADAQATLTPK